MDRQSYGRRHGDGGGGGRPNKRIRVDSCLTLKQQLIGLKTNTVISHLEQIITETKRYEGEPILITTVLSCVESLPTETSTFALLVGALCGYKDDEHMQTLGVRIMIEAVRRIKSALSRQERLLVRFLAASFKACGVALNALVENVLDPLLAGACSGSECDKADEIRLFAVLATVPWISCSQAASRSDAEEDAACRAWLAQLSQKLQPTQCVRARALKVQFAALPRAQQNRLDPDCDRVALAVMMASSSGSEAVGDNLDVDFDYLLIANASNLPNFGALHANMPDLFADLLQELTQVSSRFVNNAQDLNEHFTHLPLFKDGLQPTLDQTSLEEVRKPTLVERFLTREYILDVLGSYYSKPNEAADALLQLNSPYHAVEGCFSQMLAMPTPEHSTLFYSEVLVRMCLKAPETIPAAIEDALDRILELEPDNLDTDALDRLALWFANHVITFDLDWPWVKWRNVFQLEETRSVRNLVEIAFQRIALVQAVTKEALDEAEMPKELTDKLLSYVRTGEEQGQSPYLDEAAGQDMMVFLKTKPTAMELTQYLDKQQANGAAGEWTPITQTRLLLHCALFLGQVSFSHAKSAVDRISPALVAFAQVDADELKRITEAALQSVYEFYGPHASMQKWTVFVFGCLLDVLGPASFGVGLAWLAKLNGGAGSLSLYFKRRAMEDLLARAAQNGDEKRKALAQAASGDLDESTDLWLTRRGM